MKLQLFFQKYRLQILLTVGLRILYSVWLAVVWILVERSIPVTTKSMWESYYHLAPSSTLIGRAFIDAWLRWDAVHFMNIAAFGYGGVGAPDTVYFPLYPYLVGGLSKISTINVTIVGLLVSSLATLLALICLYELVVQLFHDEELAKWSTILLAVYPAAFFLHAPFTDALFLLFAIASILMMVKQKHLLAGLFACAAGLTRPQGALLLIPMVVFYIQACWKDKKYFRWREILAMIIATLGLAAYSLWRVKSGMAGLIQSQLQFSNIRFQNPLTTLFNSFVDIIHKPSFSQAAGLLLILLFLGLLIWMFTRPDFRQQPALMLYSAATWLLIVSKTGVTDSNLQFSHRYVLHIFFAFVGIAAIMQKWPPKTRNLLILSFLVLALVFVTLYAMWILL